MDENTMIEEIKKGNNEAFNELHETYYLKLYNYIFGKMDNKANTDDLVQIAFVKIYRNIGKYDKSKSTFYKFMLANCNQVVADYYKKKSRRDSIVENVELDEAKLGEEAIEFTDLDLNEYNVKAAMKFLTDEQRQAFRLIHMKHMSIKEAAEKMGKSESSVKSLVFRSRQVMREKIAQENPDVAKKYGYVRMLKLIIIAAVCFALVGGFAYAIYRIYVEYTKKETYTLEDVRRELPDEESDISREEATEKMNEYLEILGMDEKVYEEKITLKNDYLTLKHCWSYENEKCSIFINATNGDLISYGCFDIDNSKATFNKEKIPAEYELYSEENDNGETTYIYARKYGNIFNLFQRITIVLKESKILTVWVINYDYEDKEILIDKQQALDIAKENGINVKSIELVIDSIDFNESHCDSAIIDMMEDLENEELIFINTNVRKVWKIIDKVNKIYYMDAYNGLIYTEKDNLQKIKSN